MSTTKANFRNITVNGVIFLLIYRKKITPLTVIFLKLAFVVDIHRKEEKLCQINIESVLLDVVGWEEL
jgi:hypothetical protein